MLQPRGREFHAPRPRPISSTTLFLDLSGRSTQLTAPAAFPQGRSVSTRLAVRLGAQSDLKLTAGLLSLAPSAQDGASAPHHRESQSEAPGVRCRGPRAASSEPAEALCRVHPSPMPPAGRGPEGGLKGKRARPPRLPGPLRSVREVSGARSARTQHRAPRPRLCRRRLGAREPRFSTIDGSELEPAGPSQPQPSLQMGPFGCPHLTSRPFPAQHPPRHVPGARGLPPSGTLVLPSRTAAPGPSPPAHVGSSRRLCLCATSVH